MCRTGVRSCDTLNHVTSGILVVDKPQGWTSHDVVARTRRLAGTRKVGHAGTLDPMATGVLVLGVGSATRLLTYVTGLDKEYTATIQLGASTVTDDAEGDVLEHAGDDDIAAVSDDAVTAAVSGLTGRIEQVPSAVSAINVDGKRAYARVRAGEDVALPARPVHVAAFEVIERRRHADRIELDVRVVCSSGTYVRALARDLGAKLGIGGHLTRLRRTRVGPFELRNAHELDDIDVAHALVSPADAASVVLPRVDLSAQDALDLTHGKPIPAPSGFPSGPVAAVDVHGRLTAVVEQRGSQVRVLTGFPMEASS